MRPYANSTLRLSSRLLSVLILGASLAACGGESSETLLQKARQSLDAGDRKAAIIQLKSAIQEDGKNAEARYALGKLYVDMGDGVSAEKELRRALELGLARERALVPLGHALLLQREFDKLLEEIPSRPNGQPAEAAALLALRAEAQLGRRHLDDAALGYEAARRLDPNSIEALRGLALVALARQQPGAALALVNEAIEKSPARHEPWLLKADLLNADGKTDEAIRAYQETLKRKPDDLISHLSLATLYVRTQQFDAAQRAIDAAHKIEPGALQLGLVRGQLYFAQQKFPAARDQLQQVLKVAPKLGQAILLMGATQYALGALEQAETHLATFLNAVPDSVYARTLLASVYLKTRRPDRALDTLRPLLTAEPPNPAALALAGEAYMQRQEPARAAEYLEKAAKVAPQAAGVRTELALSRLAAGDIDRGMVELEAAAGLAGSPAQTDLALITAYLARREFDKALGAIAALEKKDPKNPLVHNLRGGAYLGKNDVPAARRAFEQALALDAAYYPAAANLAQLDFRDKNPKAARARFESVLAADKASVPAMMGLAALERAAGNEQAMLDWVKRAAAADPKALAPRGALVHYHLGKNAPAQALAVAREAQAANPTAPEAMELLGIAQLAAGEKDNAIVTFSKLAEMAPRAPGVHVRLAAAQAANERISDARRSYARALELNPDLAEAHVGLVQLDLKEQLGADALRRARQLQARQPRSPLGHSLEGDILASQKDPAGAAAAYLRAYDLDKTTLALIKLHASLHAAGKGADAETRAAQWLKAQPQDYALRSYLADHYLKTGQNKPAIAQYQAIVQAAPDNALALNNLAWLYQQEKDPRALATAERAYKLSPDAPSIADTLGWIQVQQGDARRGLALLKQAHAKTPQHPGIHYHLAAALAKTGEPAKARTELDRLLARGTPFPEEPDARALFEQLKR
ncbi:MAG: XrtA/PEP-CTERM system TPR-repeat protein PrsT [Thiobacillus sp.]